MSSNTLYEIRTGRDKNMIKAYITFINRVRYPRVTTNFLVFGILIFCLPLTASGHHPLIYGTCYLLGIFMVLMGLFRQYIPLFRMTRKDPEYLSKTITTYRFTDREILIYQNDRLFLNPGGYHKIRVLYYDESYFYLSMNEEDLFILPMNCFSVGSADTFREFLRSRSGCECRYIPVKLKNRLKKRPS